MRESDPLARVEGDRPLPVLGRVGTAVVAVAAAIVTALVFGQLSGWAVGDPAVALAVVGGAVPVAVLVTLFLTALRNVGHEVRVYDDALVVVGTGPMGRVRRSTTIPCEEVDLVVRVGVERSRDGSSTRFALLCSEESPVTLPPVEDGRTLERHLSERVPSPDERAWHVEDDYGNRRGVESNRAFWQRWPADEPIPDSPVVDFWRLPDGTERFERPAPDGPSSLESGSWSYWTLMTDAL